MEQKRPHPGRPPRLRQPFRIGVQLEEREVRKIRQIAESENVSISEVVRRAVRQLAA